MTIPPCGRSFCGSLRAFYACGEGPVKAWALRAIYINDAWVVELIEIEPTTSSERLRWRRISPDLDVRPCGLDVVTQGPDARLHSTGQSDKIDPMIVAIRSHQP